jgi:hypothetical protein
MWLFCVIVIIAIIINLLTHYFITSNVRGTTKSSPILTNSNQIIRGPIKYVNIVNNILKNYL